MFKEFGYKLPDKDEHKRYVFIFEFFTKQNRIIVQSEKEELLLHGVRNMRNLKEEDPFPIAEMYNWNTPKTFHFSNMQQVIDEAAKLDPLKQEGFVLCDPHFNRVKVKCPSYVSIHLLHKKKSDSENSQRLLAVIQKNEGSEFLSYFPNWKDLYEKMKQDYDEFCNEAEECFTLIEPLLSEEKKYASEVNKYSRFKAYLFERKKKKEFLSAKTFYSNFDQQRLYKLVYTKEEKK